MSLVLSRKIGESIIIGTDIVVTVTHNNGSAVRLRIDAPPNIIIDRSEIRELRDAGIPMRKRQS